MVFIAQVPTPSSKPYSFVQIVPRKKFDHYFWRSRFHRGPYFLLAVLYHLAQFKFHLPISLSSSLQSLHSCISEARLHLTELVPILFTHILPIIKSHHRVFWLRQHPLTATATTTATAQVSQSSSEQANYRHGTTPAGWYPTYPYISPSSTSTWQIFVSTIKEICQQCNSEALLTPLPIPVPYPALYCPSPTLAASLQWLAFVRNLTLKSWLLEIQNGQVSNRELQKHCLGREYVAGQKSTQDSTEEVETWMTGIVSNTFSVLDTPRTAHSRPSAPFPTPPLSWCVVLSSRNVRCTYLG